MSDLRRIGRLVQPVRIASGTVGDADDAHVLGCAVAGKAAFLVTGNLRHFPSRYRGMDVVTPGAFIDGDSQAG